MVGRRGTPAPPACHSSAPSARETPQATPLLRSLPPLPAFRAPVPVPLQALVSSPASGVRKCRSEWRKRRASSAPPKLGSGRSKKGWRGPVRGSRSSPLARDRRRCSRSPNTTSSVRESLALNASLPLGAVASPPLYSPTSCAGIYLGRESRADVMLLIASRPRRVGGGGVASAAPGAGLPGDARLSPSAAKHGEAGRRGAHHSRSPVGWPKRTHAPPTRRPSRGAVSP